MIQRRFVWLMVAIAVLLAFSGCHDSDGDGLQERDVSGGATAEVFDPRPASKPLYAVSQPSDDPANRTHYVTADDGTQIYVETWLPVAKDGMAPPARVPTIVLYTPYQSAGVPATYIDFVNLLVPRGYAFAHAHVRGYGSSGGCADVFQVAEGEDGAAVVQYLGRDAPWSDGNIGMIGASYEGATQFFTATAESGRQYPWLKAIIPMAPPASLYETYHHDGVQNLPEPTPFQAVYTATSLGLLNSAPPALTDLVSRVPCQPGGYVASLDSSGDYDGYFTERDARPRLGRLRAATFVTLGYRDGRALPKALDGVFDRLPADVPRTGLFGPWRHEMPNSFFNDPSDGPPRTDWERADFEDMIVAWLDQWVKGIDTGAGRWPVAQVQDTEGRWRAEADWSDPPGPRGRLALSAEGLLGAAMPSGSSSFVEAGLELQDSTYPPGTSIVFETPPFDAPLDVLGSAVADLWLTTSRPDGHIAAKLEAIGPGGALTIREARSQGARSLQHLDPLVDGVYFYQAEGKPAPVDTPINVQVRLTPTALVVPAGGRLRLTIAGSVNVWDGFNYPRQITGVPLADSLGGPSELSGSFPTITVLHDCAHPSTLRFTTRSESADWLVVREKNEPGPGDRTAAPRAADGGGMATGRVCGSAP